MSHAVIKSGNRFNPFWLSHVLCSFIFVYHVIYKRYKLGFGNATTALLRRGFHAEERNVLGEVTYCNEVGINC